MKTLTAISRGRPWTWGRCFTVVLGPGRYAVGDRARATIAEEDGLTWHGLAECFCATPRQDGRTVYDFEKVKEATWMKRGACHACGKDFIRTWRNNLFCPECGKSRRRESRNAANRRLYARKRAAAVMNQTPRSN